jgi:fatty-acid desaturase
MFNTEDLSMNNCFVGIVAMGEGWRNNHNAFEDSFRHGLKWWQFDPTFYLIWSLEKIGLARKLIYPDAKKMRELKR